MSVIVEVHISTELRVNIRAPCRLTFVEVQIVRSIGFSLVIFVISVPGNLAPSPDGGHS